MRRARGAGDRGGDRRERCTVGRPAVPQIYQLTGIGFLPMNKEPADLNASFAHDVNLVGRTLRVA